MVIGSSRRYDTRLELSLSLAAAPPSSDSEVKLTLLVRCPQTAPAKGGVFSEYILFPDWGRGGVGVRSLGVVEVRGATPI